ncbi:MAG: alginate lyase family protein [Kiritimatiellia bacterium]|jgi:hypothetical protein
MIPLLAMDLVLNHPMARWNRAEPPETLRAAAAEAMAAPLDPVTAKRCAPPGGTRHDYASKAPYWWPDPAKPDGFPYIRRDGELNPDSRRDSDRPRLDALVANVQTLAAARVRLDDRDAAGKAVSLLRGFFLDEATRMNPNLDHGQAIPGACDGRSVGVIETLRVAQFLVDSIQILHACGDLPDEDYEGLRAWFSAYLDWLLHSPIGSAEGLGKNNHGTAYDLQVAVFALFVGRDDLARATLLGVPARRVAAQIEPDGRQPLELARTRSLSYSSMNLGICRNLSTLALRFDFDLWNATTPDGRSIAKAAAWLRPYLLGEQPWTLPQVIELNREDLQWLVGPFPTP